MTLKSSLGVTQFTGNGTIRQIAYKFLLAFHSNYGDILYCLRDIASYWLKIAIFFYATPVFRVPAGGDPVGSSRKCLIFIKLE